MSDKTTSILIGGIASGVLAVLLSIPQNSCLGCLVCLVYVGAGMLAVWHYTNTNTLTISGGEGAGMGALAGLVAGLVAGILGWVFRLIGLLPGPEEILAELEEGGQLGEMDPEMADFFYSLIEFSTGPVAIIIGAVIAVILGVVGGAIGAAVFKKGGTADGTSAPHAI